MATACGDCDPAAVGIGDVVESEELSRSPTNQSASNQAEHGFDLHIAGGKSRGGT
jgi:hypothetical protein